MFTLFPNETVLEVFKKTSLQEQATLAQVDKRFNKILKNKSLELAKYIVHSVGNTHLILQESKNNKFFGAYSYCLFMIKDYKRVPCCTMYFTENSLSVIKYAQAMKSGETLSLIQLLKPHSLSENLQKALDGDEKNRATLKIK